MKPCVTKLIETRLSLCDCILDSKQNPVWQLSGKCPGSFPTCCEFCCSLLLSLSQHVVLIDMLFQLKLCLIGRIALKQLVSEKRFAICSQGGSCFLLGNPIWIGNMDYGCFSSLELWHCPCEACTVPLDLPRTQVDQPMACTLYSMHVKFFDLSNLSMSCCCKR